MKLSVSLPEDDVEFLDAYARTQGITSRSAVVLRAVRLLKASELGLAHEDAWREWVVSHDAAAWDGAVGDGLADASR